MKKTFMSLLVALPMLMACADKKQLADYVNPFIGATTLEESQRGVTTTAGKTFPGAATPFGMVQVSPQTVTGGDNTSGYSYEDKTIEGFSMTQMSGVGWYGDLGNFTVMPTTGPMHTIAGKEDGSIKGWRSRYDKATETAKAGYYSVLLTDYGIKTETTAAKHSGVMRFTFPENKASRIQIDLARRVGGTAVEEKVSVVDDHSIEGYMVCTPDGGGWGNGDGKARYTVYFHAEFSEPLTNYGFWKANIADGQKRKLEDVTSLPYLQNVAKARIIRGKKELSGKHIGFFTEFPTKEGQQVELKVGISFVDLAGARNNFKQEMEGEDFDSVRKTAHKEWNKALSCIEVSGGTEADKTVFYTALYHTMIDPREYTDCDGRYVGGDYEVYKSNGKFTKRTIFSGWDVFRSQFPLLTIIRPDVVNDMVNSLINLADESGKHYYERWEFLNSYSGCMLGNPALSVIADAYMKGIRGFDAEKALEYGKITSRTTGNGPQGYTPGGASISHTLEYAYGDWCLGLLAQFTGNWDEAKIYYERSKYYKNVFDAEKGWFRPRNEDGSWMEWPEEGRLKQGYGCIESNPLQQGWFVPHDVEGMVELMGGKEKVLADLRQMFKNTPKTFDWNNYYNHANEPVHAIPYLFNHLGAPRDTQYWTRFICKHAYGTNVRGLIGNEDVGQMSAWYVLSSTGIYQFCPGDLRFDITSPVFDKVVYHLPNGKDFTIIAHNNSHENVYIKSKKLYGKDYDVDFIIWQDILQGATLELTMGK